MRPLAVVLSVMFCCGLAAAQWQGQATVIGGYASTWIPSYAAGPFVPLLNTPEVSLDPGFSGAIGAQNATPGLVAGARNSTLSIGSSSEEPGKDITEMSRGFRFGAAASQYSVGVSSLMSPSGTRAHAARSYTNQDVDRANQSTGIVKYGGKTEELH